MSHKDIYKYLKIGQVANKKHVKRDVEAKMVNIHIGNE